MGKKLLALDLWVLVASEQDWEGQVENCLFVCLGSFPQAVLFVRFFGGERKQMERCAFRGGLICEQVL